MIFTMCPPDFADQVPLLAVVLEWSSQVGHVNRLKWFLKGCSDYIFHPLRNDSNFSYSFCLVWLCKRRLWPRFSGSGTYEHHSQNDDLLWPWHLPLPTAIYHIYLYIYICIMYLYHVHTRIYWYVHMYNT